MREQNPIDFNWPQPVRIGPLNGFFLLLILAGAFSSNPLPSIAALCQLRVFLNLFWRKNVPLVGLLLVLLPWMEISTSVLEANLRNVSLNEMLHGTGEMAYWLSFAGLSFVVLGFYSGFRKVMRFLRYDELVTAAKKTSLNWLMIGYSVIILSNSLVIAIIGGRTSSLFQLATYFNQISTVLLVAICLRQALLNEYPRKYLIFMALGLIFSFYSLFSGWKIFAYAIFIAYGMTEKVGRALASRIVILVLIFGGLGTLWQGIKQDYRIYLTGSGETGGMVSQGIVRTRQESLTKFFELSANFLSQGESEVVDAENVLLYSSLRRLGYLEFFSLVLNQVPRTTPHENGKLLKESLQFALIPRFLNPNKGVKDDGAKVERYTSFSVMASSSFSLGHYTEHFIDFGAMGMMIVLIIYGWLGSKVLTFRKQRLTLSINPLLLIGIGFVLLQSWGSFQSDMVFITGTTFFSMICHGILFQPFYRFFSKLMQNEG